MAAAVEDLSDDDLETAVETEANADARWKLRLQLRLHRQQQLHRQQRPLQLRTQYADFSISTVFPPKKQNSNIYKRFFF